ncbi:transcriptional regulator family: Fungal Specific TF [Paecilomyces variotii]|nr:transcriptional regulator family: Fungal Specific TF [Paecilomyces variotii]
MSAAVKRACELVPSLALNPAIALVFGWEVPSQRHRKRVADDDLLSKINEYEELLRRHNINFCPLDNSWIPSPLEEKLPSKHQSGCIGAGVRTQASSETQAQNSEASLLAQQLQPQTPCGRSIGAPLWLGLSRDLREPPIEQFTQSSNDGREGPVDFSSGIMALPLVPVYLPAVSGLLEMHPEPKHIFKLWQIFAENVHPLIMIIHAPTVQRRISEVCWSLDAVPKPFEAVMFAVYALAVSSMKEADCIQLFGETRSILLNRYNTGTAQALAAANLHVTRDLEVLQALVLFILLDYRSDASVTLTGLAIRIGHKMGLHRTGTDSKTPFFEEEMRVRIWWEIRCLDSRSRRLVLGLPPSRAEFGDIRMPLNINDAELHPCMASRPAVEHTGATEMLYCLMKYEVAHWMRTSPTLAAYSVNPLDMVKSTSLEAMTTKRKALAEIRQIYENKYIRYCDPTIPLHHLSATVGRLFIYRTVFSCLHPRNQPEGGRLMSQADQDEVFESSVQVLQLGYEVRRTPFSAHLLELQAAKTQVDALVYMVSELRQRVSGDLVRTAWVLVERMYKDYPDLLQDDSKFSTGLADLTLEAWDVRWRELQRHREVAVPEFIGLLQAARGKARAYDGTLDQIGGAMPGEGTQIGFLHESLDWEFWNDFLEI